MHAFKVFTLLTLISFAVFISCSFYEDESFEISFDRTNRFFSTFKASVSEKLEKIGLEVAQVDELVNVYSSILSFPLLANEQLFSFVMNNINDDDRVYERFLVFFNDTIGLELDQIQRGLNSYNEFWIDPHVEKFASDLKDAIASAVKSALNTVKPPEIQKPVPMRYSKTAIKFVDEDFDDISAEAASPISFADNAIALDSISKNIDAEVEEIMMESSNRNSPKPSLDLVFEARSLLIYGIRSSHDLFPFVKSYLAFLQENNLQIFDPSELFSSQYAYIALQRNFDIGNPGFQNFCNYLNYTTVPITSPLHRGPRISKAKKEEIKKSLLMNLARENMYSIIENLNGAQMAYNLQNQCPEFEHAVIECFISNVKDQIIAFLLILNNNASFVSGLENVIKEACQQISDIFDLSASPALSEVILQAFLTLLKSPLALIKKYDTVEDWKSYYDENSPTYKARILSPEESSSRSSGRKSVKIVEDNNEVCVIKRVADIEREFMNDKENINPITRSLTHSIRLNELAETSYPEDNIRVVRNFDSTSFPMEAPLPEVNIASNSSVFNQVNKPIIKRFSSSEVPDFPFHDSSEIVRYPEYIRDTGHYFFEQGDNSCFMLDERLYTIKEGISQFLSESFDDEKTSESVMRIFENSLKSVFKS